jgi:sorbitol-specific phosphotransferase system component IIBC
MSDNETSMREFIESIRLISKILGHQDAIISALRVLKLIGKQIDNGVISTASEAHERILNDLLAISDNYNPEPLPFESAKEKTL